MTVPPPDWVSQVPNAPWIHTQPPQPYQFTGPSADELRSLGQELLNWIWQEFLLVVNNVFVSGETAIAQLEAWAQGLIAEGLSALLSALGLPDSGALALWLQGLGATIPWQALLDAIANALGHAGVGHLVSDIQTYLGAIPGSVISGITTIEQNILDAIAQALGHAGTGHTVSDIQTYLQAIPQSVISGLGTALGNLLSTATWQTLLDAIANALGHAGTGHLVADIQTYLGSIPGTVISGITGIEQNILDAIANALGQAGTGHTVANIQTYLGAIPQSVISGLTTALGNLLSVATWQTLLDAIANALGQAGTGHTVGNIQTYLGAIPGSVISGITTVEQSIVDYINAAIGQPTGGALSTIEAALQQIPNANIIGQWEDTLQNDLDTFLGAVSNGVTDASATIAGITNALAGIANLLGFNTAAPPPANSTTGIALTNSAFIANQAATKASYIGLDPSGDPTFNFDRLAGASLPTVNFDQSGTVIGMIGTPHAGAKASVAWLGCGYTATISAMYVNTYAVNTANGTLALIAQSVNLITSGSPPPSSSTPAWYYYNFPVNIAASQGNWYAVELQVVGTGTYTLAGISHQAPTHPTVFPAQIGATRTPILITYGTKGTGNSSGSGSVASLTTSHTPAATDNGVILYIVASAYPSAATAPTAITYAGNAMSLLTTQNCDNNSTFGTLWAYTYTTGASVLPQSANSVVVTFGGATKPLSAVINVESFSNVGGFAGVAAYGVGTAFAQSSVVSAAGDIVSQAFGGATAAAASTISAYNKTQDYNQSVSDGTANGVSLTMGHAAGAATVSFSATSSVSVDWAAIAVNISPGTSITAPSTITTAGYAGATDYPFLELCGSAGTETYTPDLTTFTASGSYTIPAWANHFDVVVCGGGGGGVNGGTVLGGNGGGAGHWNAVTLSKAQVAGAGGHMTVTIGNGGGASGAGSSSSVTVTGYGTITGNGGAAGSGQAGQPLANPGTATGNDVFNSNTYYGGGGGGAGQQPGGQPGGGGAGGNSTVINGYNIYGGAGGKGAVFILAYT